MHLTKDVNLSIGERNGRALVVAAACTALLTAAVPYSVRQPQDVPPPVVIRDVRVFDGERVLPRATVVLADRRIRQVALPGQHAEVPENAASVDGTGMTLLPGLIDAHTHVQRRSDLKNAMAFGVTTELDMFISIPLMQAMKEEQTSGGAADRADLFSAGTLVTAPGGHGTEYGVVIPTLVGPDSAPSFVDARIAEGSDYIKIVYDDGSSFGISIPTLSLTTLDAVVKATHARHRLALVHIGSARGAREAIAAGADGLAHIFADRPPDGDLGTFVAAHRAFVVPTLTVLDNGSGGEGGAAVIGDAVIGPRLLPEQRVNLAVRFPEMAGNVNEIQNALDAVRALHEAGVAILAGTDAPNPGTVHGASLHRELELLVRAGLTPLEALEAATSRTADLFGLSDRGRIAPGLRADVVLVAGDPTTDILQTRDVAGIWKEGRRWKLELYMEQLAALHAALERAPGGPPPSGAESGIVSDFDASDAIGAAPSARFGAGWSVSTDAPVGTSTVTLTVLRGGAEDSPGALEISGRIGADVQPAYAGALYAPGATGSVGADLSSFDSLRFMVQGDGGEYRVLVYDVSGRGVVARRTFTAGRSWTEIVVPFAGSDTDGRGIRSILFAAVGGSPRTFSFRIDQVRFQ